MAMGFSLFKTKTRDATPFVEVDIHSHLLPGIDDGVQTMDESMEVIKNFSDLGYKKLITTPHVMSDFYKNTPEIILDKLELVRSAIKSAGLDIEIEAAAEYYLDEHFLELIENKQLLTFGENMVLFETSFTSKPMYLKEVVFKLQTNGYVPVMAHPERYLYMMDDKELLHELYNAGVLYQINLNAVAGYYSRPVLKQAKYLIDQDMVSFVGSDCHNMNHFDKFKESWSVKLTDQIRKENIRNNQL